MKFFVFNSQEGDFEEFVTEEEAINYCFDALTMESYDKDDLYVVKGDRLTYNLPSSKGNFSS